MSNYITENFPNIFFSDINTNNSELTFCYDDDNEMIKGDSLNVTINTNTFYQTKIKSDNKHVKYNNKTYTFNGFYISKQTDVVDNILSYKYFIIIENCIYGTNEYLYISIPIIDNKSGSTKFDNVLSNLEEGYSYNILGSDLNFNDIIPQDNFYSYIGRNINNTDNKINVTYILFRSSQLFANYNKLKYVKNNKKQNISNKKDYKLIGETYYKKISIPLSLSENKPTKVVSISDYVKDEIYIMCSEVQDEKFVPKKMFFYKNVSGMNFMSENMIEIILYIFVISIILFGLYNIVSK